MWGKKHIIELNVQVRALGVQGLKEGRIKSWHHVAWATNFFYAGAESFQHICCSYSIHKDMYQ